MSDHHDPHETPTRKGIGRIATWVFIILGVIIFFAMVVPGCFKGCTGASSSKPKKERREKEKEVQKVQVQVQVLIICDQDTTVIQTPWVGNLPTGCKKGQIIPRGDIWVKLPCIRDKNGRCREEINPILLRAIPVGSKVSNDDLPRFGKGAVRITAAE